MVYSVGSGRMAVMTRLLEARSFSQNVAGYVGNQKLVSRYIRKDLFDVDEPNLLDEKDMHVFGLKPMDDPLHLVCCNACKKPVKASHYAAHAEICRFLCSTRDAKIEPNYSTEPKRPPQRKQRRQVVSTNSNQLAAGRKQETRDLMDAHDNSTSETHGDKELSSFSDIAKAGNDPGNALPPSQELKQNDVDHTSCRDLLDNDMQNQYVPAPLATKIYYSYAKDRLRAAIGEMFRASCAQEFDYNLAPQAVQQEITQPRLPSQNSSPLGQNSDARLTVAEEVILAPGNSGQPSVDEALRQDVSSTTPKGST